MLAQDNNFGELSEGRLTTFVPAGIKLAMRGTLVDPMTVPRFSAGGVR
jgi:hypothetical protein